MSEKVNLSDYISREHTTRSAVERKTIGRGWV